MAIARPSYCNRDDVMRAIDMKDSILSVEQIDRAIASGADDIDGKMKRRFYPIDTTRYFDWPNYQYAEPWRFWFGKDDCCVLTLLQSPGNSGGSGGVSIPLYQVFLENVNREPGFPATSMSLDRSTVAAWGIASTPQHSIWATGTWGFTADADPVGVLADSIGTGDTTVTVSNGALIGAGDLMIVGYGRGVAPYPTYKGTAGELAPYLGERVLVQDKAAADTGLTLAGTGCTNASSSDKQLSTAGSGALNAGEVVQLGGERMLVESITAGVATVRRAWDGTLLDVHTTGDTVYALRALTVLRGQGGTTAASASASTGVSRHRPPQLVRDLNIGVAVDQVLQELSAYSRTVGQADALMRYSGTALADKWTRTARRFGRQQRTGTI